MNTRILFPFALLALTACNGGASAPDPAKQTAATEAVKLFAETCIAADGNPARVAQWAAAANIPPMTADELGKLPFGMMEVDLQQAWRLERGGTAFYLSTGAGACSVKTERADEAAARAQFTALAGQNSGSRQTVLRADHTTSSPFPFKQLSYAWVMPQGDTETVLTANTSVSDQVPVQLALIFTHRPRAAGSVTSN
ncbi:hypothetical protein [Neisseria sp.]|uniref:NMCC_0638 family (lipo)protein n=1 Tax=Neisseria sp. TaxID=192066 RepID=UPI0035A12B2A